MYPNDELPADDSLTIEQAPPPSEQETQAQMDRYLAGMQRGLSGRRLAEAAGLVVVPPTPRAVAPPLPTQWAHTMPAPGTESESDTTMRAVANLPVDKAMEAINAAKEFMAIRGYQKDIEAGKPADESLAKWAPLGLLGKKANLAGAGSFIKAVRPRPKFSFVPGTETQPASFQAPGERPVIVPRTAMPLSQTAPELIKQEVAPGIFAVRDPRSASIHIVKGSGESLTQKDRMSLITKLPSMERQATGMDPGSPEFERAQKAIQAVRAAAMGEESAAGVPTDIGFQPPPDVSARAWEPGAPPPPVAAPEPAAPARTERKFTDKKGNVYRYVGNSADPKTDKNPDNWVKE